MSGSVCWEKSRQNGQRRSANSLSVTLAFGLPGGVPCGGMPASIWVIAVLPLTAPPAEAPGLFVLLPPPELTAMAITTTTTAAASAAPMIVRRRLRAPAAASARSRSRRAWRAASLRCFFVGCVSAMKSLPQKVAGRPARPPRRTARPRSAGADPCAPPGRDEGGGTSAQAGSAVDRRPRGGRGLFVSREPPRAAVDLEPH